MATVASRVRAGTAQTCRDGTLGRVECERQLKKGTRGLLDGLESFDDDRVKQEQIDDALDSVEGPCDECEQMLRDDQPSY